MSEKEISEKLESMLPDEKWDLGKILIIKSRNCWIYYHSTEMHYTGSKSILSRLIRKIQKGEK